MKQKRFLVLDDDLLIGEMLGYFFGTLGEQYRSHPILPAFTKPLISGHQILF